MRTTIWRAVYVILALLTAAAGLGPAARAQSDDLGGLPAPARLSVAEGPVSFWRTGDPDWSQAQLNMAIEAGDAIYTGNGGTAEIQVGPRAFLRLTANTQVSIVRHDGGLLQVSLAFGDASLDVRSLPQSPLAEIDTPNASFSVDRTGYYRVGFGGDTTRFFVRHGGEATLQLRDGYDRTIGDGEQIIVRGSEELTAEIASAPPRDAWDRWNDARSDYYDQAASNRYLPADVYGGPDLDQYGTWSSVPEYGTVWYPTVAAGWAPFTVGAWHWDPVYEWTWVDAQPWGWAPCHYGRWVFIGGRWAWAPGPRVIRPVYVPAVVGFVGFGSGPTVGWVALGWGEPIVPWWGHREVRGRPSWGGWGGPRIVNREVVERHAEIDVNAIRFQNSQVSHAVATVPRDQFGHDHERHFRFATAEDGRPMPIQGGPPVRHERPPTAAPGQPAMRVPAPPGMREAVPPARGSVTVVPSARFPAIREQRSAEPQPSAPASRPERRFEGQPAVPQRQERHLEGQPAAPQRQERRLESQPSAPMPAPQIAPRPSIGHPPQPEMQPRIVEPRAPPAERREERPAQQPRRFDVVPAAPRQEAPQPRQEAPQPRHPVVVPQVSAPAPQPQAAPAPQRSEQAPAREEHRKRGQDDKRDEGPNPGRPH